MTTSNVLKSAEGFELVGDGQDFVIVTPAGVAVPFKEQAHAEHIYAQLTEPAAENRTLKADAAKAYADAYEKATRQAKHDLDDHDKVRIARMHDAVARGQKPN